MPDTQTHPVYYQFLRSLSLSLSIYIYIYKSQSMVSFFPLPLILSSSFPSLLSSSPPSYPFRPLILQYKKKQTEINRHAHKYTFMGVLVPRLSLSLYIYIYIYIFIRLTVKEIFYEQRINGIIGREGFSLSLPMILLILCLYIYIYIYLSVVLFFPLSSFSFLSLSSSFLSPHHFPSPSNLLSYLSYSFSPPYPSI